MIPNNTIQCTMLLLLLSISMSLTNVHATQSSSSPLISSTLSHSQTPKDPMFARTITRATTTHNSRRLNIDETDTNTETTKTLFYGLDTFHHSPQTTSSNDDIAQLEEYRQTSRHNLSPPPPSLQRRLTSSATAATAPTQLAPLFQGIGTHYSTIYIGSPTPQRQTVIMDTGSHYTALPCTGCVQCGETHHTDGLFDYSESTSFEMLTCTGSRRSGCEGGVGCSNRGSGEGRCEFSQSYTEGSSWRAYQSRDIIYIGAGEPTAIGGTTTSNHVVTNDNMFGVEFLFGCQYSSKGLFETQLANGIMGLSENTATFPYALFTKGVITKNEFSLCFQRRDSYSKEHGTKSGAMTLGGIDSRLHDSHMVFVKNEKSRSSSWYTVYINNIYLLPSDASAPSLSVLEQLKNIDRSKAERVSITRSQVNSGKGVIVDSGTTDTYLHSSMATAFGAVYQEIAGRHYSNSAQTLTAEQVNALPTLVVQLRSTLELNINTQDSPGIGAFDSSNPNDVILLMPPSHYMEYSSTSNKYTSRLYFTEGSGGVLGANFMQGYDVSFNWGDGLIGFALSDCDYDGLISAESVNCTLGNSYVSEVCSASVECDNGDGLTGALSGIEKIETVIIQHPSGNGETCDIVAKRMGIDTGAEFVACPNSDGTCKFDKPCTCSCGSDSAGISSDVKCSDIKKTEGSGVFMDGCFDLWSNCKTSDNGNDNGNDNGWCTQIKQKTVRNMNDDKCYAVGDVETRFCHKSEGGDCAISASHVPHVVTLKLIIVGGGGDSSSSSYGSLEEKQWIEEAIALSLSSNSNSTAGEISVEKVEKVEPGYSFTVLISIANEDDESECEVINARSEAAASAITNQTDSTHKDSFQTSLLESLKLQRPTLTSVQVVTTTMEAKLICLTPAPTPAPTPASEKVVQGLTNAKANRVVFLSFLCGISLICAGVVYWKKEVGMKGVSYSAVMDDGVEWATDVEMEAEIEMGEVGEYSDDYSVER